LTSSSARAASSSALSAVAGRAIPVVDDELDVAELARDGRDPVGVGDVELHRHEAGVGVADGRGLAHSGVDLRRAPLE